MTFIFRSRSWALAVMAAMLIGLSAPVAAAAHERCVSRHLHCRTMNMVASCCCVGDHHQPVPATTDTQHLNVPASAAPNPPGVASLCRAARLVPVRSVPLRGSPPDLLTLYGTLLI